MFAKAEQFVAEAEPRAPAIQREPLPPDRRKDNQKEEEQESSDDDMPGPALPGEQLAAQVSGRSTKSGPAIPTLQDLELKRGNPPSLPLLYPLQHLTPPSQNSPQKTPPPKTPTSAPSAASTAVPKPSDLTNSRLARKPAPKTACWRRSARKRTRTGLSRPRRRRLGAWRRSRRGICWGAMRTGWRG